MSIFHFWNVRKTDSQCCCTINGSHWSLHFRVSWHSYPEISFTPIWSRAAQFSYKKYIISATVELKGLSMFITSHLTGIRGFFFFWKITKQSQNCLFRNKLVFESLKKTYSRIHPPTQLNQSPNEHLKNCSRYQVLFEIWSNSWNTQVLRNKVRQKGWSMQQTLELTSTTDMF